MPVGSDLGFPTVIRTSGPAYVRQELAQRFKSYQRIRDCLDGEDAIKKRPQNYLPMPNKEDQSAENLERYRAYVERAVFYPVTGRTLEGLIGQIFMRDPTMTLPASLEMLADDASGDGQSLEQVTRTAADYTMSYGRCGLFVDYPDVQGPVTQADIEENGIQPTIKVYAPWHVINWRSLTRGGVEILTLVVIYEGFEVESDGFEQKLQPQCRVLAIDPKTNTYFQTIYQKQDGRGAWMPVDVFTPLDNEGKPFKTIPFKFIGSVNNNAAIDRPPLEGLASVNLAHYRNSADYEESVFLIGQPTAVFAGLTEAWVTNVFVNKKVMLGSRAAVPLPVGGAASILQAEPNTLAKEAMDTKERQMVALGAKLVQQQSVQRTATETELESTAENSVLSSVAKNVGAGLLWALQTAGKFVGALASAIEYTLSTEFDLAAMSPEERRQLMMEWQAGAIAFTEMRANLRKAGIGSLDDDKAAAAIAEETANALANAIVYTAPGSTPKPTVPPAGPTGPAPSPSGGRPKPAPAIPPKAGGKGGKGNKTGTKP